MKTLVHAVALMTARGLGRRRLADFVSAVASAGELLADAIDSGERALVEQYGLTEALSAAIYHALDNVGALADELEGRGVSATALSEPDYPQRLVDVLGPDAPPVL